MHVLYADAYGRYQEDMRGKLEGLSLLQGIDAQELSEEERAFAYAAGKRARQDDLHQRARERSRSLASEHGFAVIDESTGDESGVHLDGVTELSEQDADALHGIDRFAKKFGIQVVTVSDIAWVQGAHTKEYKPCNGFPIRTGKQLNAGDQPRAVSLYQELKLQQGGRDSAFCFGSASKDGGV